MTMLTRRSALAATLASAALANLPATTRAAERNTIRFGLAVQRVNSLDPAFNIQGEDQDVTRQIFDSLIDTPYGTFDLDPKGLVMEAAESMEISPDSKSYTLKLREGMQFHKGYGEVTADDAKFTLDRLRDPASGSGYLLTYVPIDDVAVLDKYRFRITLKQPDPTFYGKALIARAALIVSRKAVEKLGEGFRRAPVGSGPFEFEAIDPNRGTILKPFEQYHGGRPAVDGVEFRYVADSTARTLGFAKGELDIIEGVRLPGWTDDIRRQVPKAKIDLTRPGSNNMVSFNLTRKPFDDLRVRQAIRYAVDRKVLSEAYGDLYGDVWGINPPEYPGGFTRDDLPAELRFDYDPAKAKQLLAEAGFPKGFGFEQEMSQREDFQGIYLLLQDMLKQVGVEMRLKTVEHVRFHTDMNHDLGTLVLNSETTAPVGTLLFESSLLGNAVVDANGGGRANFSHYGRAMPGIDELYARIAAEPDLEKRLALTRDAELRVLRDMPAWNALSLHWVFARSPRLDLGYAIKASYAYFTLMKARFVD
ncbi:MAG: hypothetical protein JO326_13810 [Acetobacteraceae bacterium]|nr:hypothetical protein [Acetobacteraceae bacterium]